MDKEDVLRLAEESGFLINQNRSIEGYQYKRSFYPEKIEAFANAIAAHEREECAKLANNYDRSHTSHNICLAIRARGNK
jgi:hypothetical protein